MIFIVITKYQSSKATVEWTTSRKNKNKEEKRGKNRKQRTRTKTR
jgi:heme-degrading monooxygenase HmoA